MKKTLHILLVLFLLAIKTIAQPGTNDTTFNPIVIFGNAANNQVSTSFLQPDGKIIIGGNFTTYNSKARNRIARLNADGSLDKTFNPGMGANDYVGNAVLQPDGKIIIFGGFSSYNGTSINNIARLNADGSLDTTFNPGTGAVNSIYKATLQSDGKIIIVGNFTSYFGTPINRIARLNTDGTLDTLFNPGTGTAGHGGHNSYYSINSVVLQPDGKIIIVGDFYSFNGISRNRIARLNADGTLDTLFNPGTGANSTVSEVVLQPDGKIIIGGMFSSYNSTAINCIARLNADGSLDTTFNPGTGNVFGFYTAALQSDGKIIIGGMFSSYNGTPTNNIARLNTDGTLDTLFNPGTGATGTGPFHLVNTSALQPDGKIIIGGDFTTYNGTPRNHVVRLNADGTLDKFFNPETGANNYVYTAALQPDGRIIIGGDFTSYFGTPINRIARLNADGSLDTTFNMGTGVDSWIHTAVLQPDGKIIIGGDFTSYNGTPINRIARLNADGSLDTTFNPGAGASAWVLTVVLQPDGKIIIGGAFTSFNGISRNRIARLNADGTLDTLFNPGTGASLNIWTADLQTDGKIIIGGEFTSYNGTSIRRIARLNAYGSLDTTFNPGTGANNWIYTAVLQPDGKIIIGGGFNYYNNTLQANFARLNTDGSLDTVFSGETSVGGRVTTAALQPDGKIIIGGGVTYCNGMPRNRIARLNSNGTLDTLFNPGTGANNWIYTAVLQPDGNIIIGGDFTSYDGICRNRIARINGVCLTTTTNTTIASSCDSYTWAVNGQSYTISGTYTFVTNCHTEELVLTIDSVSDISTSLIGATITANNNNASYQWLDCDNGYSPISGATSQSYTATSSGNYAVELTENGCVAISNCITVSITSIENLENKFDISVFPNPNNGTFRISLPKELFGQTMVLTNAVGEILQTTTINSTSVEYNLMNFANGIYYLQMQTDGGVISKMIVKN